ncbi:hypothetical protein UFOVP696_10 [uncultured Caudovirales phage]|uniref:Uncharacterized protein n=1 Tax=uncultured Caudovirales phage TaxID=2100421 RepID=A0A6J5MND8_9CAUD|nr:hypothetical protein UFOVP429_3 [uncultured Caudovirales phage]CAB4158113.1 hypothetical protein UFOVP696_10 [uncultured Caudovirales phage]
MALQLFEIAEFTVSNPVTSVTFSAIPQGYSDLKLLTSTRNSSTTPEEVLTFNGSSTGFSDIVLYSYNGLVGSNNSTPIRATSNMSAQTADAFSHTEYYIPNYALGAHKTVVSDSTSVNNDTGNGFIFITAGLWANTAAITSVTVTSGGSGFFVPNSLFTLYGVL